MPRTAILRLLLLTLPLVPLHAEEPAPAAAVAATAPVITSDATQEAHWAARIRASLSVGKALDLAVGQQKVLALYTEELRGSRLGGVILLHGTGSHPDQPAVIHPLRTRLPDQGWSTLSLQMPIRPAGTPLKEYAALFEEAATRIEVAIQFLKSQGIDNIVLVGHSLGAVMGADYLATRKSPDISGFVAIGMADYGKLDPHFDTVAAIEQIEVPILDIFGNHDLPSVTQTAGARSQAAQRGANLIKQERRTARFEQAPIVTARDGSPDVGMVTYRQIEISGADHYFSGQDALLIKRIRGWLERHTTRVNRYITVE